MAVLSRAVRNARAMMRAGEWGDSSIPPNSANGLSSSGGGQAGIEALSLSISTVLACVKALSDDLSSIPFHAYSGDRFGPRAPLAEQPLIVTEPFGPDLDAASGRGQLVVSTAMRGNGYGFYTHWDERTLLPDQMLILHPDAVKTTRRNGRKMHKIGHDWYGTDEVLHVTGMMLPNAVAGVDVLTQQRLVWEMALSVTQYGTGFFGNGGSPSGVIEHPGSGDRRKAREVKEAWEDSHAGVHNAHRPAVLFGGAKWNAMSVSPENAQFLDTRRFTREEICGIFGVPLQRVQAIVDNASQGGGAGMNTIDGSYAKHTLLPLATSFEAAWNPLIPGEQRSWSLFDLDAFLRADAKTRADIRQINRVTAVRTPDEERADEGWAPLPDGQGSNPGTPLNSNASPTGGTDNTPKPGGEGGTS